MNDPQAPSDFDNPKPVAVWRRWLAKVVLVSYGFGMWIVFSNALVVFLIILSKRHFVAAVVAGTFMTIGFLGTICLAKFAPHIWGVNASEAGRRTVLSPFLRRFRAIVGNGDFIQGVARRIDPSWRNPYTGRTPQKTANWLFTAEVIHWAAIAGSIPPIAAGFRYDYHVFSSIYVAANLIYNVFPILVIRDTRRRVRRISQRMG